MADKKFEEMNWAERVQDLYGQITNRPAFQYDPNSDPMYQTVKDQYVRQGQRAMEDTMGQAAALTGGYNNSYAQSAGQQQYNDQMTKLSAQIPVLAQKARAAYDAEGDRLRDQANWAQQQRAYQDDQNYRNWQMQQEEQDRAYQMVMQMVATGQVPPAELLASAGVSADYAKSMANYYGRQAALAAGGGSGSGSRGSSSGRDKQYSQTPNVTEPPHKLTTQEKTAAAGVATGAIGANVAQAAAQQAASQQAAAQTAAYNSLKQQLDKIRLSGIGGDALHRNMENTIWTYYKQGRITEQQARELADYAATAFTRIAP